MEKTVGIAELTSITYGIAASDAMLKAGQVRMLRSAPMCPGKYLIVIGGDTGEVKAAMEAGAELAGKHLRNSYVIPHIHEQVLDALSKKSKVRYSATSAERIRSMACCLRRIWIHLVRW